MRVLSLIASSTEIVCALGYESALVGRSHECDYPAAAAALPAVTSPRFNVDGTSAEIDQRVKELVVRDPARDALGVYEVDVELLRKLRPTHIVTQTQCEVCAVSLRDVEAAIRDWTDCDARIVPLAPNSLEDVWEDFRRVGRAFGDDAAGERLVEECRRRIEAVSERVAGLPRRTVAVVEWVDPLMAGGNWTPTLVEAAGGENLFGEAGKHSPWMEWDALVAADPGVIVVAPCGYGLERTLEDVALLRDKPGWSRLRAVREGRSYAADGNAFFNRPGPRLAETTEILGAMIHPEAFGGATRGAGWEAVR